MTPENKAIVLQALRSGDFTQHRGGICNAIRKDVTPTSFCCIGVMDKVINNELALNRYEERETGNSAQAVGLDGLFLNDEAFAYLKARDVDFTGAELVSTVLIALNDSYKWDFKQIADFVEVAL